MSARGGRGKSGNSIAGRLRAVGAWRRSGDGRERRGLEEWSADVQSDPGVAGCQPPGSGRESELAAAPGGIRWLVPGACRILPSRVLGTRTTREENAGRGVAQPGRASDWGSEGRRFESCRPDQLHKGLTTSVVSPFLVGVKPPSNLGGVGVWCRPRPAVTIHVVVCLPLRGRSLDRRSLARQHRAGKEQSFFPVRIRRQQYKPTSVRPIART